MSDHREAIAEWLHAQLCVGMTTASAEPCASCYSDADALLGSDVLAQIRAEARAEERADHLTPDEIATLLAEARAEALREVAGEWQAGEWTVLTAPIKAGEQVQRIIGAAQAVTDWLRARAEGSA